MPKMRESFECENQMSKKKIPSWKKKKLKSFELVLRGLPIEGDMLVGVQISRADMDYLYAEGRIIIDVQPPTKEPQVDSKLEKIQISKPPHKK